jgi:hypothetical protein
MALKYALTIGGLAALRQKADSAAGISSEDRKRLNMRMLEFPLPFSDENGNAISVNASWLLPYSNLMQIPDNWKSVRQMGRSLLPMFGQAPATIATQQDRFGRQIVNMTKPKEDRSFAEQEQANRENADLRLSVFSEMFPGMFGQYWASLYKNSQKDPNKQQPVLAQAFTGPALGVRSKIPNKLTPIQEMIQRDMKKDRPLTIREMIERDRKELGGKQ